jgi:hypothetical protein
VLGKCGKVETAKAGRRSKPRKVFRTLAEIMMVVEGGYRRFIPNQIPLIN